MQNQLQKVINLTKKTGDRIIVFDNNKPEDTFVVMSLDEYEKIIIGKSEVRRLTEDELLDKINRDIAIWKSDNGESICGKTKNGNDQDLYFNEDDELNDDNEYDELKDDDDDRMYYYDDIELENDNIHSIIEEDEEKNKKNFYGKNEYAPNFFKEKNRKDKKNNWTIPSDIKKEAINF